MTPGQLGLWLRWSRRDLRRRWVLVTAIALILAIGTGMFAALGSTATWRRISNDRSFEAVAFHDLRLELGPGSTVTEGRLLALVGDLAHPELVQTAAERLRVPTQVDASTDSRTILVRGELMGVDVSDGDPGVDRIHVAEGEPLVPGGPAVLEQKFAAAYDLPATGSVLIAGRDEVAYQGVGSGPEEFLVIGDEAGLLGERNWATVYLPLDRVQQLSGLGGQVNDLVLTVTPGADVDGVRAELQTVVDRQLAEAGATISGQRDVVAFRTLYDDIDNDQKVWNIFAGLILVGATFAVFNLVSREVESRRREIGVGMALGLGTGSVALRPMLLGVQVAVLGCLLGVGVGLLVGEAMKNLMTEFIPLPVWVFEFQPSRYAVAIALGIALPVVAAALPVWRAVRVQPVEAIRTGHLSVSTSRLTALGRTVRIPGRSLTQMPFRNLLRQPRRTLLTATAIGAAITVMIALVGMIDSMVRTADLSEHELTRTAPDRLDVSLVGFEPVESEVIDAVRSDPTVGAAVAALQIPATLEADHDGADVQVLVRILDFDTALWTPTTDGTVDGVDPLDGVILSRKAASDLGVGPGDPVRMRHVVATSDSAAGFTTTVSTFRVGGLHPDPIRAFTYLDARYATTFGLAGVANYLQVEPRAGVGPDEVTAALFDVPQLAAAQPVDVLARTVNEAVEEFAGFLRVMQFGVLVLALLIAFNSASISVDERAREHATMLAFGVPVRSLLGVTVTESVLIGVVGTALGIAGGFAVLSWMIDVLLADTLPELGLVRYVATGTLALSALLGVAAVAVAPALAIRRVARMDIPDMLRYVE